MDYVISDTHFGHNRINELAKRPFGNSEEADACLIDAWNRTVTPKDTVYHLGDVAWGGCQNVNRYLRRLHGRIFIVQGNHDPGNLGMRLEAGVRDRVHVYGGDIAYLKLPFLTTDARQRIVISHFPLASWLGDYHGAIHFHGHSHGRLADYKPRRLDVGVDNHDLDGLRRYPYGPIKVSDAIEFALERSVVHLMDVPNPLATVEDEL